MIIENKIMEIGKLKCILRCSVPLDAEELSNLRVKIDGETEFLDRVPYENLLTKQDFEEIIYEDSKDPKSLFLVAEIDGKIVGFTRCIGNKLTRFSHKAEFGICILKQYWGFSIGTVLLENVLLWADTALIEKISLTVVETNTKAISLYEKHGFIKEGLLINDRIHKDGNYYNTVIMGRFKEKATL